ncbi:MAG: hypothetical protein V2A56_00795 [bacterium]
MATFPGTDHQLVLNARRWSGGMAKGWLLPWLLLLMVVLSAVFEWYESPVERAFGDFMVWSRPVRPEAGRAWELNQQGADAMKTLGALSQTSRLRQAAGGSLTRWSMVPAMMDSFDVFSISPQRFIDLYDQLPPALQSMVIKPIELVRVRTAGTWQRVFFVREGDRRMLYFVDPYNVVLYQVKLLDSFFERYNRFSRPVEGYLDQIGQYSIIAPSESFFQVLAPAGKVELSPNELRWIASLEGRLASVGLVATATDHLWEIGFEVEREGRVLVYRYWISKAEGEALTSGLAGFKRSPQSGRTPQ